MASVSWTATTSGTWSTATNWSTHGAPLRGDDVSLNAAGAVSVSYINTSLVLNSLLSNQNTNLSVSGSNSVLVAQNGYSLSGGLNLSGGSVRLVSGAYGNGLSGVINQTGGTLTLVGGGSINNTAQSWTQSAAGTLNILRGTFTDYQATTSLAGVLNVVGGVFIDRSANTTLSGLLTGNGTVVLAGGPVQFVSGLVLGVANLQVSSNSTINLSTDITDTHQFQLGAYGTLSLNNKTLTLGGSSNGTLFGNGALYGTITNGGVVVEAGFGSLNGLNVINGSVVRVTGAVSQTGNVVLGQSSGAGGGTLSVASTGVLRLTGNSAITVGSTGNTVNNDGLITKVAGNPAFGSSFIDSAINNNGIISADFGTIDFAGPNSAAVVSQINGTLAGAGTIRFDQGYYALGNKLTGANAASVALQAAHLVFTGQSTQVTLSALSYGVDSSQHPLSAYNGSWDQTGGLLLFQNDLSLGGLTALDGGEVKGTATINFAGGSSLHLGTGMDLEGNLTFRVGYDRSVTGTVVTYTASQMSGPVVQSGAIQLGALSDSVDEVFVSAQNRWVLEGGASITGAFGTINNAGTFEKLSGPQNSFVGGKFNNSISVTNSVNGSVTTTTGTLLVDTGTLSLTGNGTLAGVVGGHAALDIGGAFAVSSGISLSVGEFILDNNALLNLNGDLAYAGDWANEGGIVNLNQHTLALSGTASLLSGGFSGTGLVTVNAATVIGIGGNQPAFQLAQGSDLLIVSKAEQAGNLQIISGASAPTLTIGATAIYTLDSGVYIGAQQNQSAAGTLVIAGKLQASGAGTTSINTSVTLGDGVSSGTIALSYGDMKFLGPLSGTGSITISNGGTLELDTSAYVTNTIGFGANGGVLSLGTPAEFAGLVANFAAGDVIELQGFAFNAATPVLSNGGKTVTITESNGVSIALNFTSTQLSSQLMLGEGANGGLALIHI